MTRRILVNALRIAISAAAIAVAAMMIDFGRLGAAFSKVDRTAALLLAPLMVIPLLLMAWRWWLILSANGFDVPFRRALVLMWIGSFFNQFLPGSVGGDVARMFLTAKGSDRAAGAASTVLLDRLIGLATTIVLAAATLPFAWSPEIRRPAMIVFALFGGLAGAGLVTYTPLVRATRWGRWIGSRLPFRASLAAVDEVVLSVRRHPRMLVASFLLSLGAQVVTIVTAWGMARAMGLPVRFLPFLVFEPIIFIFTAAIPSVGGWGVQEIAYRELFPLIGVAPAEAVALSLLVRAAAIVAALPGGVLFAAGAHARKGGASDPRPLAPPA